jgi:RecB family exonuclease
VAVGQEQKHVDIGALRLRMRVDRLDTVAEGRKLLIDYKTGKVSPRSWEGERPEDPQLPLYASFGELGDICGLLFAQIRAGEIEVKGRAEDAVAAVHPGLSPQQDLVKKPLTAEMRSQWRTELEKLAEGFLRGETTVDPKHPAKTCQMCDLSSLCRKAETLIPLRAAEQDENEINDDQNGN